MSISIEYSPASTGREFCQNLRVLPSHVPDYLKVHSQYPDEEVLEHREVVLHRTLTLIVEPFLLLSVGVSQASPHENIEDLLISYGSFSYVHILATYDEWGIGGEVLEQFVACVLEIV